VRVDLRRRDVGVAEQRLENAEVGSAGKQVRREGVAEHMRAYALGRNAGVGSHLSHDLEQAYSAEMRLSAGKEPQGGAGNMFGPALDSCLRARRNRHEPFLAALAAKDEEWLPLA